MNLPKTILVPTDFGEVSDCAVDYAVGLAKALDGEVVLLHAFVIPVVGFPDGAMVATVDMTNQILEGARVGLERVAKQYEPSGVRLRSCIKQGDPWRTVVETAKELGADLIVMGTHGRRGLPRALLGSVAEKVVRTAHVPVLTIHAGDTEPAPSSLRGERTARSTTAGVNPASRH